VTSTVATTNGMMDFSLPSEPIRFRVDDDVFDAAPDIAAELALIFAAEAELLSDENTPTEKKIEIIHKLFRMVLLPESADLFIARLRDSARPIGIRRFERIVNWLLEQYGLRPTESDSDS